MKHHYTSTGYLHYITDNADGSIYWVAKAVNARARSRTSTPAMGSRRWRRETIHGMADGVHEYRARGRRQVIQQWGYTFDEAGNYDPVSRSDQVVASTSVETFTMIG